MDLVEHDEALGRHTHLTGVVVGAVHGRFRGLLDVRVGGNDGGPVARHLHDGPLEAHLRDDPLTGGRRAGEPDRVHATVRHE